MHEYTYLAFLEDGVYIPVRPSLPAASFAAAGAAAALAGGGCIVVSVYVDRRPAGELAMLSIAVYSMR